MTHSLIICEEVANRMKDLSFVRETVFSEIARNNFPGTFWMENSFADGLPGIACFYTAMDRVFPDNGWDLIAHQYLSESIAFFEKEGSIGSLSLFTGFSGLCLSLHMCSYGGERYQNILSKLDLFFIEHVERNILFEARKKIGENAFLSIYDYNLCDGLSGILTYLVMRTDKEELQNLALECAKTLIDLVNIQPTYMGSEISAWYVSKEHQVIPGEGEKYPEGSFLLGMGFGITGVLASLALAHLSGIDLPNMKETIEKLSKWIQGVAYEKESVLCWTNTLPYIHEEDFSNTQRAVKKVSGEIERDSWWQGIPAVARSLYLAGRAVQNEGLMEYAAAAYKGVFSKSKKDMNLMGPSFMHGRAGFLSILYHMAEDLQDPVLQKHVKEWEEDLCTFFRPGAAFGFQMVDVSEHEEYRWVDHPGLLTGAAGIALSLLLVQNREQLAWDRAFVIN